MNEPAGRTRIEGEATRAQASAGYFKVATAGAECHVDRYVPLRVEATAAAMTRAAFFLHETAPGRPFLIPCREGCLAMAPKPSSTRQASRRLGGRAS